VQFTGITCRLDVIELLEKRVKSRFSHRQIFLFLGEESGNNLDHRLERLQQFLLIPSDAKLDVTPSFKKLWNNHIDLLLRDKNFKNAMQRLLDLDLSEKSLKNILVSLFHDLLYYNRIVHLKCIMKMFLRKSQFPPLRASQNGRFTTKTRSFLTSNSKCHLNKKNSQ
jgi:hypothetical protein